MAKDEHVAVLSRGRPELGTLVTVQPIAATDHVGVARSVMLAVTDDGDFWETNANISLWTQQDGLVHRIELFGDDDADGAMARAAELDPDGFGTAEAPDEELHEPWNEADRLHREILNATQSWDIGKWRRMMADDVLTEDRRPLLQHVLRRHAAAEAFYGDEEWKQRRHRCDVTTVASRGDDLVLLDMRWTPADDPDGPALEHLQVCRWADGQLVHVITFDPDDLRAALDELDRMFLAALDPITAGEHRHAIRFLNYLSDGELEPVMAVQGPDAVMVDHRPLGWGNGAAPRRTPRAFPDADRVGELDHRVRSSIPPLLTAADLHRHPDRQPVTRGRPLRRRPHRRVENRSGDRIRGSGWTSSPTSSSTRPWRSSTPPWPRSRLSCRQPNLASPSRHRRQRRRHAAAHSTTSSRSWPTTSSPNSPTAGPSPSTTSARAASTRPRSASGSPTAESCRSSATRASLMFVGLADERFRWSVEETDATGRLHRIRHFAADDLLGAASHIEAHWRSVEASPESVAALNTWSVALRTQDRTLMSPVLADDFMFRDHRAIGFGRLGRESFLEVFDATDESDLGTLIAIVVHTVTERIVVVHSAAIQVTDSNELWEANPSASVVAVREGQLTDLELFPTDQLDAALARAAELDPEGFGVQTSPAGDDHDPWNRADRLNRLATEHFFAGRIDAWAAMIANNYQGEQRRKLLSHDFTTKRDLETANRAMLEHVTTLLAQIETLATALR